MPVIIFLHGNAGHIGIRVDRMQSFIRQGFGVLLLEYRGYANNPGQPSEHGLYDDARAAIALTRSFRDVMTPVIPWYVTMWTCVRWIPV